MNTCRVTRRWLVGTGAANPQSHSARWAGSPAADAATFARVFYVASHLRKAWSKLIAMGYHGLGGNRRS